LARLKDMNRRPNVSIQVATFDQGVNLGMKGSFTVFEFPTDDQDHAIYVEQPYRDALIQNDPVEASGYMETFFELETLARPASDLDKVIDRVLEQQFGE